MNAALLKILLEWARTQLAEKLSPKKSEPSPEKLALDAVREVLKGYDARYGDTVDVKELYNALYVALNTGESSIWSQMTSRKPFQPNPITAKYVAKHVGAPWAWPGIIGPAQLWYHDHFSSIPALLAHFERIPAYQKGAPGDIVVLDSRVGGGYGVTGFLLEDQGATVRLFADDGGSLRHQIIEKAAVLGYFRPKPPEKA